LPRAPVHVDEIDAARSAIIGVRPDVEKLIVQLGRLPRRWTRWATR